MLNFANLRPMATRVAGRGLLQVQKYSPEILTTVGIVGVVAAGVMASRATLKLSPILEEKNTLVALANDTLEDEAAIAAGYNEETRRKDVAKVYIQTGLKVVKLYGPAITLGAFSVLSIVSAHGIMRRRNVALAAAYKTVETAFREYRDRVAAEIGDDREKDISRNVYLESVKNEETGEETQEHLAHLGHSPYAKFFDELSSQWRKNSDYNLMFVRTQEQIFNDLLHARGHVFLNEVYDAFDIPRTQAGQMVGWVRGNGDSFIDFGVYDLNDENKRAFVNGFERSILLDFNVDGVIYNLI